MLGYVKEQHLGFLSEDERQSKAKIWWIEPTPPTYNWPPDEYIMISEVIEAEPIPYNLKVGFFKPSENIARLVELGWVDLSAPVPET